MLLFSDEHTRIYDTLVRGEGLFIILQCAMGELQPDDKRL